MKKTSVLLCAVVLLAVNSGFAGDKTFDNVVHHIESHYHAHRTAGFLMGFAGLTVKFWHPAGVKNLKMALFDDRQFLKAEEDTQFDDVVRSALDEGWQPVVHTHSLRSGDHTYIYAHPEGKEMKLLMVVLDPGDAVVMQVRINTDQLSKFVKDHERHGYQYHDRQEHREQEEDEGL
ncbi:MAG TPA: hypothetical protein VKZ53_03655 [Candidatus Angelobacter sp.]|nr:hypothetical protein [Candidatus Angelobacter sp.]